MTIEEKAKDYAGYNISFPDGATAAEMDSKYDGFRAVAEWMLEKALDWIEDNIVSNKFGETINPEDFIKAIKEK